CTRDRGLDGFDYW
nr:immunoglobulin heavy chain junction region [Macaca mulatta]MPN83885.1 immunoglobulin heavy chain junction region [Macaca mulatta]MPN83891.1 immunoglobulin heavy chain junction region [Macaca mulatta]MPN83911.1 immunoglobulin heavy chain junction region [Macaca mulatta]MPN83914.1 immunoglobulin heavy chain junction region [Macaca mulatta]